MDTPDPAWNVGTRARSVHLDPGIYAVIVGKATARSTIVAGFSLPATNISAGPLGGHAPVLIVASSGEGAGWLDDSGGTVVAKAPPGGGDILITSYGITDDGELPSLQVVSLGELASVGVTPQPMGPSTETRSAGEIACELSLHVERQGDRTVLNQGWVGNPGQRLRLEAFAVRPLEAIAPSEIEYMGFGPGGRQTAWVTEAQLCGTRGRGLPLTGFAIRLAPPLRDRFDVIYDGYFFESGLKGPARNGEPCLPSGVDDPLSAIRVRLIERSSV